jgi:hypothetical protein
MNLRFFFQEVVAAWNYQNIFSLPIIAHQQYVIGLDFREREELDLDIKAFGHEFSGGCQRRFEADNIDRDGGRFEGIVDFIFHSVLLLLLLDRLVQHLAWVGEEIAEAELNEP